MPKVNAQKDIKQASVIRSNIRRAYEACSSWDLFHKEINQTRQVLINKGYSNTRIDEEINKYLNQQHDDKNKDKNI